MLRTVGFKRALFALLVQGCLITCGITPLHAAAPVTLRISTETAPPGGWAQFKIYAAAPTLLAAGQISIDFDPTIFGAVAQIAAFSSTGDQIGYAHVSAQHADASFSSPSAGFGQLPELPIFVVTVPVLATAKPGVTFSITADPEAAWTGPQGNQYAVTIQPSTFTVGGSLSIQAATPGGGLLPAGTMVKLTGTGFDAATTAAIDGVSLSQTLFVAPGQLILTLGGATEMTGKHVHVSNSSGASADYYSALPSAPPDPGQGFTTFPNVTPILPLTTYTSSQTFNPIATVSAIWGFAMQNPSLTPAKITFEGFQTNGGKILQPLFVETIEIPQGQLYVLDASSMLRSLELTGELWITASRPIRYINIRNASSAGVSVSLPNLAVGSPPPIQVILPASTNSASWSWQIGSPPPAPATVALTGGFDFTTAVSTTPPQWLSVSAVKNGATSTLTLTPNLSNLVPGTYAGTVTVTPIAPASFTGAEVVSTTINVSLVVSSMPLISTVPMGCCYFPEPVPNQPAGPPEAMMVVTNGNPAPVMISASTNTTANWLTVSPLSGMTPLQLTVTANPAGLNLPAGSYSGQITIRGPANTVTVTVTLSVFALPPPSPPGTSLKINGPPPGFTIAAGTPPSMSAAAFLSFQEFDVALTSVTTDVPWLTASIDSPGPSPPNAPAGVELYPNSQGLSPGAYSGTITINSSNYPVLKVPASLTVIAAPTSQTVLTAGPASFSFTAESGSQSSPQSLSIGFNTGPVLFNFAFGTAPWFQIQPAPGFTTAEPVYTVSASATNLPPGTYYSALVITWTTGSTIVPITFSVTATAVLPPIMTSVTNSASGTPRSIAAGEIITILGSGVGGTPTGLQLDPSGKIATKLADTQVLIGGSAAPLIYSSAGQLNSIVPFEVGVNGTTTVQVISGGIASEIWEIPLAPSASSVFTADSTGEGQAAVLNQDNSVNGPSNPALRGTVIQIYANGGGQTHPAGITGALALPGENLTLPVTITIGNVAATVQYAGSAPGEVEGLIQINAVVPTQVMPALAVPISLKIGGAISQPGVTIAVN